MDRLALPHHGIDMASEARREVRRTGGEEDKPEAGRAGSGGSSLQTALCSR